MPLRLATYTGDHAKQAIDTVVNDLPKTIAEDIRDQIFAGVLKAVARVTF